MTSATNMVRPIKPDWTQPEFMRIASTVEEITGISFPLNRRASAEAVMRKVMSTVGMTSPVSLEIGVSRRGAVLELLLDGLTIGESYFFREPAQLRFMAEELLPKWSSEWEAGRTLRVWSAGCAAGQEPYSIAILLRDAAWRHKYQILGTDISEGRLEVARKAKFSKWSLRTLAPETTDRWFERKATEFQLVPEIRAEVDFKTLNLLDPAPRTEFQNQDVIFCRNVLIYFEIPAITTIAERLLQSLSPDGWLFLGASDPHLAELTACEVVVLPGCTGYRRTSAARSTYALRNAPLTLIIPDESLQHSTEIDELPDALPTGLPSTIERDAPSEWIPVVSQKTVEPGEPEQAVALARELANGGRLVEAGKVCAAALEKFPDQAQLHLISAVLSGEAGRWTESERAAKRALYLDRTLVLAHVALGDAMAHNGNVAAARRSFENAAGILASRESEEASGDGEMSTARLTDIVRAHLSLLAGEPPEGARARPGHRTGAG